VLVKDSNVMLSCTTNFFCADDISVVATLNLNWRFDVSDDQTGAAIVRLEIGIAPGAEHQLHHRCSCDFLKLRMVLHQSMQVRTKVNLSFSNSFRVG